MKAIAKDKMTSKHLELPCCKLTINMYSCVVKNPMGQIKLIRRAANNNRELRKRPEHAEKNFQLSLVLDGPSRGIRRSGFAKTSFEFGYAWGELVKSDKRARPSFEEIMTGLFRWYTDQLRTRTKDKSKAVQLRMMQIARKTFNDLMEKANIPAERTSEPLHAYDMDEDLDLANPYSKISCFILYLYSLEFGDPPLYTEVNRAARMNDMSKVETLGPFQRALISITSQAEKARDPDDRIKNGEYIFMNDGGLQFNIAGIFLLFRGMPMRNEWLQNYESKINPPTCVRLPGSVSCSRDLHVAFKFATVNIK